ncbi:MAG: hypothetical protein AAF654_11950 [Myxococcota bacterium]
MSLKHREDFDRIGPYSVNQSVVSVDHFSKVFGPEFGDMPSAVRCFGESLCELDELQYEIRGCGWIVLL